MKLGKLQVHRPDSVERALETRVEHGDDAAFYAGGTELLLVMKLGLADYLHLIDLKRIGILSELSVGDQEIKVGAAATYRKIEADAEFRRVFPSFVRMVGEIGNLRVRSTGTLGGNLVFADPHSDPLTFLIAAGGSMDLVRSDGSTRQIPVDEFTVAPYITRIEADEILSAIRLPTPPPQRRFVHRHVRFRERPALTITVAADVGQDRVDNVSLAIGALIGVPRRIEAAENLIEQGAADLEIREAVAVALDPSDDLDGSADYKLHLAGVLAVRAVQELLSEEHGGGTWK